MFLKGFLLCWCVLFSKTSHSSALLDPISIGIAGIVAGAGWLNRKLIADNTYCRLNECCNEQWLESENDAVRKLESGLTLYGQHIVKQQLTAAFSAHYHPFKSSERPLVLSFHGITGTGKSYTADVLTNAIFTQGAKSKFVHKYVGNLNFNKIDSSYSQMLRLSIEVRAGIEACKRSIFIFDKVDEMPAKILDGLIALLEYNAVADKLDLSRAIFIFISKSGGALISDRLGKMIEAGKSREEAELADFEQMLRINAFDSSNSGGLYKSQLIEAHLIDNFLPFLPLEKSHVVECIKRAYRQVLKANPTYEEIAKVLKTAVVWDTRYGLFATSGCKQITQKVNMERYAGRV